MFDAIIYLCAAASAALGLFIIMKPELTIELQRRFYELINWRIEPVSMSKEIRNTRMMGMFLFAVSLFVTLFHVGQH